LKSCSTRSRKCASVRLPVNEILGASTLNIGTISGGRAPNVIPDHAQAELFIRLVDSGDARSNP
jgi:acetylornithine deacetylase